MLELKTDRPIAVPEPGGEYRRVGLPGRVRVAVWLFDEDHNSAFAQELTREFQACDYLLQFYSGWGENPLFASGDEPDLLVVKVAEPLCEKRTADLQAIFLEMRGRRCPLFFIAPGDDFHSRLYAARLGAKAYFLDTLLAEELCAQISEFVEGAHFSRPRVLILSDEAGLSQRYRERLELCGMKVAVECEAEAIADRLSQFQPDLLLIKLQMCSYAAADIVMVIRQLDIWSYLPIIYLASERESRLNVRGHDAGPEGILWEPIVAGELDAIVRNRIRQSRKLQLAASKDCLTGLLNQRSIKEAIAATMLRASRQEQPVTLVMVDIDRFKSVNDTYGHVIGDKVLSAVAMLLRRRLRRTDLIGRYGGDEFLLALPECDQGQALRLMTSISRQLEKEYFSCRGRQFFCTISAGLAGTDLYPGYDVDGLTEAADRALYLAKKGGRNQVVMSVADAAVGGL